MASLGVWRVQTAEGVRLARGAASSGPSELLPAELDLDSVLGDGAYSLGDLVAPDKIEGTSWEHVGTVLAPVWSQDVWAAGVTYERSRTARNEESGSPDYYDKVYAAKRPELFFKSAARGVRGPGAFIGVRSDSAWNVPEPELGLVIDSTGLIVGYVIGNDVSSRSIEGENPLYLPQAKVYRGSCSLGPCLVPVEESVPVTDMTIRMTIRRSGSNIFDEFVRVADMHRTPEELVDWLFRAQDFPHGTVLLTGTSIVPPPSLTLLPEDTVTIAIDGLGSLTNIVELVNTGDAV